MTDNYNLLAAKISSVGDRIIVNTKDGTVIQTDGNTVLRVTGTFNGEDKPHFNIHTIRGSIDDPQVLQSGDYGMNMSFTTYFDKKGKDIGKSLATLVPQINPNANTSDNAPASNLNILVGAGDGKGDLYNNYMVWRFKSNGSIETKILQCSEQNNNDIDKIVPTNGMIIYNSDVNKFQGYANGTWVNLH